MTVTTTGGATAHLSLLNNSGGAPNDIAGTLQGIDNIEVTRPRGQVALGAWRYTKDQDDILDLDAAGDPAPRTAAGAYLLLEQPLWSAGGDLRAVAGFLRLGVSDGDTTPFKGGGQAGLLMTQVVPNRPDSALSFGVAYGGLSDKFQQTLAGGGRRAAAAESTLELTYADRAAPRLMLQPSVQYVVHPGGTRDADPVVVLTLRVSIDL